MREAIQDDRLIVRSSALNEDTNESSQAGKFESVGDVCGEKAFFEAVHTVVSSFDDTNPDNQILVQPMLQSVKNMWCCIYDGSEYNGKLLCD